jgi:squalene-hopene/tetraprenyl-beta-curcumene cyclase
MNADFVVTISRHDELVEKVDLMIDRARFALLAQQHPEGYWQAPLEMNAEMNAEYIIFQRFMELPPDPELARKLAKQIHETQQGDGSWALFPGGEGDLSTTIEAYFGLKLTGMRAGDEPMMQARRWILSKGGVAKSNTLARFYLAAMNQVPWHATAAMPVELTLLPKWFPLSMYELSSWARGTLFALMMLQAKKPAVQVDSRQGVLELYIQPPHLTKFTTPGGRMLSLRNLLRGADKALSLYDGHHLKSLRARALRHAENWLLEHQDANGSWGGIQPCYILSPMALKGLGYRNDHPVIVRALEAVRELVWDLGDSIIYQPCVSPNWDTALAAKALLEAGLPGDHPALRRAAKWLTDHQIFKKGDWSIKRPDLEPGGWAFQFYNDWYPDVDDSAMILMVLAEAGHDDTAARQRAVRLGANWVIGMQSKDGGFAAFDVDNDSEWLNQAPFADLEAAD